MDKKLTAIFIGHGRCGANGLRALMEFEPGLQIAYVVNHRETSDGPNLVSDLAAEYGIPCFEKRTDHPEFAAILKKVAPDIAFIMRHPYKICNDVIRSFPMGIINIHPSNLPRFRGIAPIQHFMVAGDPLVCTAIKVTVGLDEGPIVGKSDPVSVDGKYFEEVEMMAFEETRDLLITTVSNLLKEKMFRETPQDHSIASTARRADLPKLLSIDLYEDTTIEVYRKILARGCDGTLATSVGKGLGPKHVKIAVKRALPGYLAGSIGAIWSDGATTFLGCKDGVIELMDAAQGTEIQIEAFIPYFGLRPMQDHRAPILVENFSNLGVNLH